MSIDSFLFFLTITKQCKILCLLPKFPAKDEKYQAVKINRYLKCTFNLRIYSCSFFLWPIILYFPFGILMWKNNGVSAWQVLLIGNTENTCLRGFCKDPCTDWISSEMHKCIVPFELLHRVFTRKFTGKVLRRMAIQK